jgi:hypothetical protein
VAIPRPGRAEGVAATPAGSPGRVVGVARYDRMAGETARFLVFVDASWRRAGLGTLLVCGLAELADLHDSGPLSDDEFAAKRAEIIERIRPDFGKSSGGRQHIVSPLSHVLSVIAGV